MKITVDTNVLLRDAVQDDPHQARIAAKTLRGAEQIVIPLAVLCEFVWVLRGNYKIAATDIANAVKQLIETSNIITNRPAVEAGLAMLGTGGDFAAGALAFEGRQLGGDRFVTFDVKAATLLNSQDIPATLLS